MVKSSEKMPAAVAPFLKKCYDMVDDDSTDSIISWSGNGSSFIIWNTTEFSVQLLPKCFKHSNFSSFIRQLNIYGFRKIDTDRWEFANDGFIRGQKHLLAAIVRRKHSQTTDSRKLQNEQDSVDESAENIEDANLWREIESLKTDKNTVMEELIKLKQYQEVADNNLLYLKTRILGMEKSQKQMLSFLLMVMQNPSYIVQLLHLKENNWRMAEPGGIIEQEIDEMEPLLSDGTIVRYQQPAHEVPSTTNSSHENSHDVTTVEEAKDLISSPDLMKALMDDNFSLLESLSKFILPEISDDRAWEQLLLCSPFSEHIETTEQNKTQEDRDEMSPGRFDRYQDLDFLKEELEKSRISIESLIASDNQFENSLNNSSLQDDGSFGS